MRGHFLREPVSLVLLCFFTGMEPVLFQTLKPWIVRFSLSQAMMHTASRPGVESHHPRLQHRLEPDCVFEGACGQERWPGKTRC